MRSSARSPTLFSGGSTTAARRRSLRDSLIVGLLCLLVYSANCRSINAGDTYPARYIPFVIWKWHTVLLDPVSDIVAQGRIAIKPVKQSDGSLWHGAQPDDAFWMVHLPSGHNVSLYPLIVPVVVSPLYLPAVAYLNATSWNPYHLDQVARIMEKVSASVLAAISSALFFLLLRRRTSQLLALLLTFAYAFGTTTWVISSQALWQHGVAELLVVCALLLLTGTATRGGAIALGLILSLMSFNRPPDSLIALAFAAYGIWWWARRFWLLLVAAALLPAVPLLIYNLGIVGHIVGTYGLVGKTSFFAHNPIEGLAGLLFSPTRGLFVFSPFLLFVPLCLPRILRDKATRTLTLVALAAVVAQLLVYAPTDWRQGGSWGPRWLTDIVPILIWMLPPALTGLRTTARAIFVVAVGAAMILQTIGAFWFTGASIEGVYAASTGSNPMQAAWKVKNAPFLAELRHAPAPFELATEVRGFVDVMTVDYGPSGREINLTGWALEGKHSPQEVVALLDGKPVASIATLGPRPDVNSTLGAEGPSGWNLAIAASGLSPGRHLVALLARAKADGDLRLFDERTFFEKPDLLYSERRAEDLLAARQQQPGYWLTSFTSELRFEHPKQEMNTYLPALVVDILSPAKNSRLDSNLNRARQFLTGQIESDGLVRYHGLPNARTIGTLGCAITPDSDDTALVWRIAPGAQGKLLQSALGILAAYRTKDGLYRTWLAPQDHYQCIDPGTDPDPADIGIQMHVFLMLSQADSAAGKALCSAIQRTIHEDSKWVYYKSAPLVPILRQADLQEAGCSVQIPEPHQQTKVAGQEVWISAARTLLRLRLGGSQRPDPAEVRALLRQLSEDDFLLVRHSPPLLYQNDQTASVRRYYWSEEFGYALWQRLYFESDQHGSGGAK